MKWRDTERSYASREGGRRLFGSKVSEFTTVVPFRSGLFERREPSILLSQKFAWVVGE